MKGWIEKWIGIGVCMCGRSSADNWISKISYLKKQIETITLIKSSQKTILQNKE